jgi:hypothetical protein
MTSQRVALAAGIDVGQRFLDIGLAPSGKTFRVPNAAEGIAAILARLTQEGVGRVVLEAIGPYAQRLVSALAAAGFEVGLVNPRRIKAFREFEGRRAKTDRLDARLIARFALAMTDAIRPLPTAEQLALRALSTRRRQLTEMIAMEKTRLKQVAEPLLAGQPPCRHCRSQRGMPAHRSRVNSSHRQRSAAGLYFRNPHVHSWHRPKGCDRPGHRSTRDRTFRSQSHCQSRGFGSAYQSVRQCSATGRHLGRPSMRSYRPLHGRSGGEPA